MPDVPKTLIASLHYAIAPAFRFADLAAEIDDALTDIGPDDYQVAEAETQAIFDVDGTRLVLVLEDHRGLPADIRSLTHGAVATLVLTLGPAPGAIAAPSIADHRHALLSILTERIQRHSSAVHSLWSEMHGPFTPADFAPLIGLSAYAFDDDQPEAPEAWAPAPRLSPNLRQKLDRLTTRFQTLTLPPAAAETHFPLQADHVVPNRAFIAHTHSEIANSLPDLPKTNVSKMQEIRAALYAEPAQAQAAGTGAAGAKAAAARAPLPQRLTIYTMNTTLMLVSLPIGSAILVHNLWRGEDMNFTARAIALSGTVIGLGQLLLSGTLTPFA